MVERMLSAPEVITKRLDPESSPGKHLDLRLLSQFLAVCDAPSMTAAAARLGLSTPAVSQLVVKLEREVDVVLFERSSHGVRLTPAGAVMRDRARQLLESEDDILRELEAYRERLIPRLRIHVVSSVAIHLMPVIVSQLNHAVGQLDIRSGHEPKYVEDLLRGEIDLTISTEDMHDIPSIEQFRLCEEKLIGIVPTSMRHCSLTELTEALPFIRFTRGRRLQRLVENYLTTININPPVGIECSTPGPTMELVSSGLGWTVATPLTVSYLKADLSKVAFIRLPEPVASRRIYLAAQANALLDLPQRLAEHCRNALHTSVAAWKNDSGYQVWFDMVRVESASSTTRQHIGPRGRTGSVHPLGAHRR